MFLKTHKVSEQIRIDKMVFKKTGLKFAIYELALIPHKWHSVLKLLIQINWLRNIFCASQLFIKPNYSLTNFLIITPLFVSTFIKYTPVRKSDILMFVLI